VTTPELTPMPVQDGPAPTLPTSTGPAPKTHACVRCGAPVPLDVGLCEKCNPLGLRDSSSSQVHGTVIIAVLIGIVGLALLARMTIAGIGPFTASVAGVTAAETGLVVSLTVRNDGTSAGQTTCRLTDPKDRNGGKGAFMLSPQLDPGETRTFSQTVTEFGTTPRELVVECSAP
jgi:ribosomal protein L40E